MAGLKEILGQRIREERARRRNPDGQRMKIADLAEKIGSDEEVVGRIERGDSWPEIATLKKLAAALDLNELDLLAHLPSSSDTPERLKAMTALNNLAMRLPDEDLKIAVELVSVIAKSKQSPQSE